MKDSKLIRLLEKLTASELKRFQKFLDSPYFNEREDVRALYAHIRKTAPRFLHTRLRKERAYAAVFPNTKAYDDQKMRLLMSYLFRLAETFMAQQAFDKNEFQRRHYLLQAYGNKQLERHFASTFSKTSALQAKETHKSAAHFQRQFALEQEMNRHIESGLNRDAEPNLQRLSDSLDAFYLINKLKCCCAILNYSNISGLDYRLPLVDEILLHLSQHDYEHIPIIVLYYNALLMLTTNDGQYFEQLHRLLPDFALQLPSAEARDLYVLTRNYCIKRINKGDGSFMEALFTLYKTELEQGLLLESGIIAPFTYKNVVALGLRLKRFDWVRDFIYQYKTNLPPERGESLFSYNLARWHFERGEFDEVIPLLHQTENADLLTTLSARSMLLRTYYELDELDALEAQLDSFRLYLQRNKSIGYHRQHYLNLIRMVKKLIGLSYGNTEKLEAFKRLVQQTPALADKQWLLRKMDFLGG